MEIAHQQMNAIARLGGMVLFVTYVGYFRYLFNISPPNLIKKIDVILSVHNNVGIVFRLTKHSNFPLGME